MRTFWLTWMWLVRTLMVFNAALIAWGIATGAILRIITGVTCLAINAGNAELCRRRWLKQALR